MTLPRGLYETLLTEALRERLEHLDARHRASEVPLPDADAADRLALHVAQVVERAVAGLPEGERARRGTRLARLLILHLVEALGPHDLADPTPRAALRAEQPADPAGLLTGVRRVMPGGGTETLTAPLIPLLDTTLLTNAPGEPSVGRQLVEEIDSADRVDIVMAFIRRSGIRPMLDAFARFTDSGRPLRVLTTTYTGSTEAAALDALQAIGAQVRVSYEQGGTRLHAKAFLFHRDSGFSTAYIGSSNLTHTAQVTGLEWNVRVSGVRNRSVVDKVAAVFDSYWEGRDFEPYRRAAFDARCPRSDAEPGFVLPPTELRLEPFQERLLEQIELARRQGRHRNLLVAATGTGKTVMAAAWYARLRVALPRARLLFVAHRVELLEQARWTFRHALRAHDFGESWVDGERPERYEHVFASIQSLRRETLDRIEPDHFDVVIVDEFHHAAADSYVALLERLRPRDLLGLTATPERADARSVLDVFDGRIAAELRLWEAIDQRRLVPFAYYGVSDGLDLTQLPWRRGVGYDVTGLTNLLTANDAWAHGVLRQLVRRTDGPSCVRAIGFCVSVDHARFMARVFVAAGVAAKAVWADTTSSDRSQALSDLACGRLNVLFAVDLFNEGLDVPSVDTLLLLRPTDSPTLFLQQIGRGLRRHPGKSVCTVLDFVGQHRREFRFDRRLRALLGGSRSGLIDQVDRGFPFLPAGCHMELDAVARRLVLENLKQGIASSRTRRVEALREQAAAGGEVRLRDFLAATGLDVEDVYHGQRGWTELCADAGLPLREAGPLEAELRRACGRLLHVDDPQRLGAWSAWVARDEAPDAETLTERDRRLLRMLVAALLTSRRVPAATSLADGANLLWRHPQVMRELAELFEVLTDRIGHLTVPLDDHPDVPLQGHARYTRIEILAAFGVGEGARVHAWQTGVHWAQQARADLLAFTLDKSAGSFSPNTRYRDYAIGPSMIHWESQSTTRAESPTGRRYQRHAAQGASVMLFGRETTTDRAFHFLGPATYVDHRGELPMAIRWRLHHPLPGDLYARYAAAAA